MFEFTDRVPASGKANRKKLTHSDGSVEYVTIENADDANPVGTPLNKATFEAMQEAIMPVVGTYTGNGEAERFIDLGFTPAAVLVMYEGARVGDQSGASIGTGYGGYATVNNPAIFNDKKIIEISENGFFVFYNTTGNYSADTNHLNSVYTVLVIKEQEVVEWL